MKLKVGGIYENGWGSIVRIVRVSSCPRRPYVGICEGDEVWYTEEGVDLDGGPRDRLVSELSAGLRVYTAEGEGVYLGSIAVVVAFSPEQAANLLSAAMATEGVPQTVKPEQMKLLPTNEPKAVVLFNGDY